MNKVLEEIQPSATLAIAAKAKQLAAEGHKVCSFAAGEPDFDTPECIKQACLKALSEGMTKYTPARGLPELCVSVAKKFKNANNIEYTPEQVIISGGGKQSLSVAFLALLNTGDEVIIPSPYWLSYPEMVRMAGGVPVFVKGEDKDGFKISPEMLEASITTRTRAFVLNSPSNPTGLVYTEDELRALGEVCVKHNVWIISDEMYERMVYGGTKHVSIASLSQDIYDHTLTINGVSKAYAMTGWRIGYAAGPLPLIKSMTTVQSHLASAPATFSQYASVVALEQAEKDIQPMLKAFEERNERMYELLSEIDGVVCRRPMGAFYMFPNISAFGMKSRDFAQRLIEEKHVAAVPGVSFGSRENLRFSYACSMEMIEEGMRRFKEFCDSLPRAK